MPIPSGVSRIVFGGTAPGGEIFQWGFWMKGAASSAANASGQADDIAAVWADFPVRGSFLDLIKNDSAYTFIKVYSYPTGGPSATYVGEHTLTVGGGNQGAGSGNGPLYQCMVVSTHTALSGRTHRGRFYLPASGTTLSTSHRFETTAITAVATSVKLLLDGINSIDPTEASQVVVLSQKTSSTQAMTEIEVDSKPDVQRRRENRMAPGATESRDLA